MCSACLAKPLGCLVCPDGTSECAHYVLQNGVCAIEYCPATPTTAAPAVPTSPPVFDAGVVLVGAPLLGCPEIPTCAPNVVCTEVINGCEMTCSCPKPGPWECSSPCLNDP
jgi:hypothetical protein